MLIGAPLLNVIFIGVFDMPYAAIGALPYIFALVMGTIPTVVPDCVYFIGVLAPLSPFIHEGGGVLYFGSYTDSAAFIFGFSLRL